MVQVFGGVGYTSHNDVVNYYETWYLDIDNSNSGKVEDVQEKLFDIFSGLDYC